jgi:hypothetical protein
MRRDTSTVVALVGEVTEPLLAELGHSPNVTVVRAPAAGAGAAGAADSAVLPAWETGAAALREAARRNSPYVLVADDPLADVASAWRQMWETAGGPEPPARFETSAAEALTAWRARRFELPDYYLVIASAQADGTGADLYLGPLRAARPHRVAAQITAGPPRAGLVLAALRSLPHGPWWPPLDQLIDSVRTFYAGGLTEAAAGPGQQH